MKEIAFSELKKEITRFFDLDTRELHVLRGNDDNNPFMLMSGFVGINFRMKQDILLCLFQKSRVIEIDTENEHLTIAQAFEDARKICYVDLKDDEEFDLPEDFDYLHISLYHIPECDRAKISRKVLLRIRDAYKESGRKTWLYHTNLIYHMDHNGLDRDPVLDDLMENAAKYNIIPTFGIHDLEYFDDVLWERFSKLSYAVILMQSAMVLAKLKETYGWSEELVHFVKDADIGDGIVVCKGEKRVAKLHTDPCTVLYAIATSRDVEYRIINNEE